MAQADRSARREAGEPRAGDRAAEPPRILELRRVPGVRRARAVHELRADADLSQARPAAAVSLLRVRGKDSAKLRQVRERAYLLPGYRLGGRGKGDGPGLF